MNQYICVHGHFYQPPRENPWLEAIELQDSAYPYHDWNEKITAECYGTNATSRILDDRRRIVQIVNNYGNMSFNFGPTLLAWLEAKAPDVYIAILNADKEGMAKFSGHGGAMAQAYNHPILPLLNRRDKRTQILWGIRDFEHRFGRHPEGMWLPETAVDLETLELLAESGISFTVLAPHQAKRVRPLRRGTCIAAHQAGQARPEKDSRWRDVTGGKIDPTMGYLLQLPSRRTINVLFYDGPISRAVAFEGLLNQGETFAKRLTSGFSAARDWPQLVHIATDGESYGHHHRHGDMALAYALQYIESRKLAQLTVYGEYLEKHPPTHEVDIYENTSWSCAHGIERWRSDCGCNTGGRPGWTQAWRTPLREALDWLRDRLIPEYELNAAKYVLDPWAARDDYIDVVLNRSAANVNSFINQHAVRPLQSAERETVLKLLELQRHALLMYTSCGWFFDELSGIETVQVIQYAGRALQLAQELFGNEIETHFLELLSRAKSNIAEFHDGRLIFEKFVRPAVVDLKKVAAHYAISSLFEEYAEHTNIYCYTVEKKRYDGFATGSAKLAIGSVKLSSEITGESQDLCFGVLHFGDHNLNCGVMDYAGAKPFEALYKEISDAFQRADLLIAIRLLDKHFGASTYSLKSLFRDEQRKILNLILETALNDAEDTYRLLYNRYAPMMRFLKDSGVPIPRALYAAAELILNVSIRQALEEEQFDADRIESLLHEANLVGVSLHVESLEYALRKNLETVSEEIVQAPAQEALLERLQDVLDLVRRLPFEANLWKTQNLYYMLLRNQFPSVRKQADQQNEQARRWIRRFAAIGELLSVKVE
ncbi:MAG: DUF3536 domain-containing protein [Candidatus Abyssobacteria bacterium SURF_5]|uniref:DUF3536 domain-containing protein n=1 Tax=Abyssobacteria bacterium (strain SURF_5) TaxID=2093360 RepID=A0A3A4NPI1_ABYX5|nr:MAG: DUF3536 domain-containing protein [Candidatus Abyssubacteria bacterium SURF_5]